MVESRLGPARNDTVSLPAALLINQYNTVVVFENFDR